MRATGALFRAVTGVPAAAWDGGGRLLVRARGGDRVRFLDGMVSNEVAGLAERSCYATLLSRKGRILADLHVLALPQEILLDFAPGTGERGLEALEKHRIADDVEFDSPAELGARLVFEGPDALERARLAGAPALEPGALVQDDRLLWWRGGGVTELAVSAIGSAAAVGDLAAAAALPELASAAVHTLQVATFQPVYGRDMSDANFPDEARLELAISRSKGCYVGQEIVARIHARGAVNRLLVQLSSAELPEIGADVTSAGRNVGSVTSVTASPLEGPLALAYVKAELARPGTELEVVARGGAQRARVTGPPFEDAAALTAV